MTHPRESAGMRDVGGKGGQHELIVTGDDSRWVYTGRSRRELLSSFCVRYWCISSSIGLLTSGA